MTATHKNNDGVEREPRVGIFWLYEGKLIIDSTPVSQVSRTETMSATPSATSITGRSFRAKGWCRQKLNTRRLLVDGPGITSVKSDTGYVPTAVF
jgi:hypothetical protein